MPVELLKMFVMLILGIIFLTGYCLGILMIASIAIVYFFLYVYDVFFGDWLFEFGKYISDKQPRLKEIYILKMIKKILNLEAYI